MLISEKDKAQNCNCKHLSVHITDVLPEAPFLIPSLDNNNNNKKEFTAPQCFLFLVILYNH